MPIAAEEDIVRAIRTDKWDGTRIAPSLFTGENTSVSRLAVIPLSEHWDMFRKHLEKPPEPRPEDWNPAHAEIPQKITRGLATKIVSALKRHPPSPRNQESH